MIDSTAVLAAELAQRVKFVPVVNVNYPVRMVSQNARMFVSIPKAITQTAELVEILALLEKFVLLVNASSLAN